MRTRPSEGSALFAQIDLTTGVLIALDLEVIDFRTGHKEFEEIDFSWPLRSLAGRSEISGARRSQFSPG
jgi:hypothetical protein